MKEFALVFGASLLGWLVPEFLLMFSPHAEKLKRVPTLVNLICVAAFGLIAYGIVA